MILNLLNSFFRWSHQKVFCTLFSLTLTIIYKQYKLEIYLRNSILEKDYFHFLYSDIDIAIISPHLNELLKTKIRWWLTFFKIIYPFRGEIECYLPIDWTLLNHEKKMLGDWYKVTRQVRKFFWFNPKDLNAPVSKKIARLNRIVRQKIGLPQTASVQDLLERTVRDIVNDDFYKIDFKEANSYFHSYFQIHLIVPFDKGNTGVAVSPKIAILLAVCFPIDTTALEANRNLIESLHSINPGLKSLQKSLELIDRLEISASLQNLIS